MNRLLIIVMLICGVSRAADPAPQTDASLTVSDLLQLASTAKASPSAGSPFGALGIGMNDSAEPPSPTTQQAIDASIERLRKVGLLAPDRKLTASGEAMWRALASPQVAVQAKRLSIEGIGAVWYGLTSKDLWILSPQKDGSFRVLGPFPRADAEKLLASRIALPASDKATAFNESFDLFEWLILLCVERERIAALSIEAGQSVGLGATAEQVSIGLLTPRAVSVLSTDPSIDPTEVMKKFSDTTSIAQMLESLVEKGWLESARSGGAARYLLSSNGAALARQALYPRETLQLTAISNRNGQVCAAVAQFCTATEGRAIVRYVPATHQFVIQSIPAGDSATIYAQTIATLLRESESPSTIARVASTTQPVHAISGAANGPLLGETIREELSRGSFRTASAVRTRQVWSRGKPDVWCVSRREDKKVDIEYEDTDGDDTPDLVRVRDFPDSPFTRSFISRDGKWEESNILEAYLEVTFKLPWSRSEYHKHDVSVILNDHVIAQLTDVIPEGLYRFPVRPQDLKVQPDSAQTNDVRLETSHLRGGHYIVSSDFNLTIRLSQVSRYIVADSPAEAEKSLRESAQLRASGVDLAMYANRFSVDPPVPKSDETAVVRGEVHNIGMETANDYRLQVYDGDPAKGGTLISEGPLASIEPGDVLAVEVKWKAKPGQHVIYATLAVPSNVTDQRRDNNQVTLCITAGGDTDAPLLAIAEPTEGVTITAGKLKIKGTATDNVALAAIECSVDGGLWTPVLIGERWELMIELEKGSHRIQLRARDTSGLTTEQSVKLMCN